MTSSDSNFHIFTAASSSYYVILSSLYDDVCDKATAMALGEADIDINHSGDGRGDNYFSYSYIDDIVVYNDQAASSAAYISTADYTCAGLFFLYSN
mmetsp:Transcript_10954/g.8130  ORF Transcript_10954/g.8130 Transcript_10954/m.8130 type:complete len:96 (-) Transcript_10954:222-509(-)|eukprot:CAMPEP_0202960336 /NCGR_PEP_ID=MMETSP1396-20130829/4478_1 /ASSEMBLY_ACC=CAM_ASM_000872 /TAXON_ID= /ORGANISM="Pseudokeronopsis sp., Strain Brazil" /LENGTH=95 /DNA_ID=CAMNT_0049679479 /DNA_START=313 /DNA_END=600 /DNA_ORIENTATION=+